MLSSTKYTSTVTRYSSLQEYKYVDSKIKEEIKAHLDKHIDEFFKHKKIEFIEDKSVMLDIAINPLKPLKDVSDLIKSTDKYDFASRVLGIHIIHSNEGTRAILSNIIFNLSGRQYNMDLIKYAIKSLIACDVITSLMIMSSSLNDLNLAISSDKFVTVLGLCIDFNKGLDKEKEDIKMLNNAAFSFNNNRELSLISNEDMDICISLFESHEELLHMVPLMKEHVKFLRSKNHFPKKISRILSK